MTTFATARPVRTAPLERRRPARAAHPRVDPTPRPLVVTADPAVIGYATRAAALVGKDPLVTLDPTWEQWVGAPVVFLGVDVLATFTPPDLRGEVYVLAVAETVPDHVWRPALHVSATAVAHLPAAWNWLVEVVDETR